MHDVGFTNAMIVRSRQALPRQNLKEYYGGYFPEIPICSTVLFRIIALLLFILTLLSLSAVGFLFTMAAINLLFVLICLQPMYVNVATMRHVLRQPVVDTDSWPWEPILVNKFFKVTGEAYVQLRANDGWQGRTSRTSF